MDIYALEQMCYELWERLPMDGKNLFLAYCMGMYEGNPDTRIVGYNRNACTMSGAFAPCGGSMFTAFTKAQLESILSYSWRHLS